MPKSKAEKERLDTAAKAQHVLSRMHIQSPPASVITFKQPKSNDVSQPAGEIDYSKFNKSASKAKK